MRTTIPTAVLVAAVLVSAGCATDPSAGYSSESVYSDSIQTIAVPIFENDTYFRDVQFDLTDAIIKELESRTPYRLASQAKADSILIGHIRKVELDQISKSRFTGLGEEVLYGVTIDFQWMDLRTDQTLVEQRSFTSYGLFVPSTPTGERKEIGRFSAVQQLASDVVDELQSAW